MRRSNARRGATRGLVMGLLALAGCGREDVPADAAPLRSSAAALESGPDLVVTQVRGPVSAWHGQGFTATVRVCNQGTAPVYNLPRVELFLSTDDTLTLPDPGTPPGPSGDQVSIGYADLSQPLQPGQCENRSVSANAILPPAAQGDGAYYLAAAIDTTHVEPEAREDNNV
ncbi:MAG TPA: CARDB domain-containing protein, partial [Archangium sp.]|nr:CARDB domain-containing protein [Archangium sp.]